MSAICIQPYRLHFYNRNAGALQQEIWNELSGGLWQSFSIQNYLYNETLPPNRPYDRKPIFPNILAVPPGFVWSAAAGRVEEDLYAPTFIDTSKEQFYLLCEKYFKSFEGRKIAVHLSGGLDSSIIIGLLHKFRIPFSLAGFVSNRYEFRTERLVQEKLAALASETVLIDLDEHPPFSKLLQKPPHQLPDDNIKHIEAAKAISDACRNLGAEVVFSGQGGDSIFVDAIPARPGVWSCNIGYEYVQNYEADFLYPQYDLELVSFFADKRIIDSLYSLRLGQPFDPLKKWARSFFKDVLPKELSEFAYSADFFASSMAGLHNAKPEIEALFRTAFEITGDSFFSSEETKRFLQTDVFDLEFDSYSDFCSRISIAAWCNSLKTAGIIN